MLNIKTDFRQVRQALKTLKRESERGVISTLNRTAFQLAKEEWPRIADKHIDRPTPFTKRGGRYTKARRGRMRAVIFLAPKQERYLLPILTGKRVRKIVPGVIRLNRYGNIANLRDGKKVKQLQGKPGHFRRTINGTDAIWKRVGGRLRPVLLFDTLVRIRKRFDFARAMARPAERRLRLNARRALSQAVRRARL